MLFTSRLNAGIPTAGTGYELNAIAACVIGGASLFGAKGGAFGAAAGALIVGDPQQRRQPAGRERVLPADHHRRADPRRRRLRPVAEPGQVSVDPRAGTLPQESDLVDVDALLAAYRERAAGRRCRSVPQGTAAPRWRGPSTRRTSPRSARRSAATARRRGSTARCSSGATRTRCRSRRPRRSSRCWPRTASTCVVDAGGGATPTPVISHAILTHNRGDGRGTADGIVVTPSHNPPGDGGFKYNPPHGGPADTDVTGWIEQRGQRAARRRARRRAAHLVAGHGAPARLRAARTSPTSAR